MLHQIYLFVSGTYFLIPAIIAQTFNPIAELVIPIRIPIKEGKVEIEIHPTIVEARNKKVFNLV